MEPLMKRLERHGETRLGVGALDSPLVALDRGADVREGSHRLDVGGGSDDHLADDVGEAARLLGVGALLKLVARAGRDGHGDVVHRAVRLAVRRGRRHRRLRLVQHNTRIDVLGGTKTTAATARHVVCFVRNEDDVLGRKKKNSHSLNQ